MTMREAAPCRSAAWAKMFVVLMAMAAIPAWTLGQPKPEPKGAEKKSPTFDEKQVQELLKGLRLELELQDLKKVETKPAPQRVGAQVDPTAKPSELDAKIAELKKQIEMLIATKSAKEIADKMKKLEPLKFEIKDNKVRIIVIDGNTGKILWSNESEPKDAPKWGWEAKPLPGQPLGGGLAPGAGTRVERKIETIKIDPKAPTPQTNPYTGRPMPKLDDAQAQLEAARKALEMQLKSVQPQVGKPALPPVVERYQSVPAVPGATKVINLTQATYPLSKEKSETLMAFLKANVKASVLELKFGGDGLTVLTTPEAQTTIGNLIGLMKGPEATTLKLRILNMAEEKK